MASTRLTRAHTPRVLGLFRLGTRLVRVRADDRASIDTTTYTSQAPLDYNPSLSRVLSTNSVTPLAHTYCALHLRANLPSAKVARHSPSRSPSSNVFPISTSQENSTIGRQLGDNWATIGRQLGDNSPTI
jgi:hypothetical protein